MKETSMMISALSSTPMASAAAPSPSMPPAPAPVVDPPNDGDGDDRAASPVSSPAAQSSSGVQAALPSLTLGG